MPKRRGAPIDEARVRNWVDRFHGYRVPVTGARVRAWLDQFSPPDQDLAARVLDCVQFVTHKKMEERLVRLVRGLPGWQSPSKLAGKWRFVPFSSSVGESGDTMLHLCRSALGLSSRRHRGLFIHKSQLLAEALGPDDTVIFVDDFAGTGSQACGGWAELRELLPDMPRSYLLLVGATRTARQRINERTGLTVRSSVILGDQDNIFSAGCGHFTRSEKQRLSSYCQRANSRQPRGFGECGLLLVLAHKTPNNSIAVLHANHNRWRGLFPRYE